MTRRTAVLLIVGILVFFILFQFFPNPLLRSQSILGRILYSPRIALSGFASNISLNKSLKSLSLENQSLRAQLADLKREVSPSEDPDYLEASLFLQHPLKGSSILTVDAGSRDGIEEGAFALATEGIFLGQVQDTQNELSQLKTIFDTGWELPVTIGDSLVSGLFIGSSIPEITLISKTQAIAVGDRVTLAAEGFPLGFSIGFIESIKEEPASPFQEAQINIPYKLIDLRTVLISR